MISGSALVGVTLDSRYEILTRIHTGAGATVYQGRDLQTNRLVAIKSISQHEFGKYHEAVLRFRREMQILATIHHPNIIEIYDRGETPYGITYFVMQWLNGRTLLDELDHVGQLELTRIQAILAPLCDAVAVIHQAGIIHRDLKPGNIFLSKTSEGREHVTLLDFGIAKPLFDWESDDFEISTESLAVGTPEYMSPEQCSEKDLTPASDIYSLGVVLYRMLAGRPPFIGPAQYIMARHIAGEPPPLHLRRPHLPEAVASVALRALAKDPDGRFASALDLRVAFDQALAEVDEDVIYQRVQPPETDEAGAWKRTRQMDALKPPNLGPET
ncbi:MAG: serine/threonine-protein kinase [Chloracidobacterium sp.]|uniref:Serine/threonine protein kinase n=1 Tax=Chloracidobacterium validum TaxID=2821543 RepID=A0ABX8BA18_9BACT|nr:serine/threonine-protein kinase [Chloracidobacterium validum]QUW03773.1 serine/threonine protein kinase [Chloracidobacterium validum]